MNEHGTDEERGSAESPQAWNDANLTRELSKAERDVLRRFDPGTRALVIATVMLFLVLSWVLPWVGNASGWEVLTGQADPALDVGLIPWMFAMNATVVGLGLSALSLITRRWVLALITGLASCVVSLESLVSFWTQQTNPQASPGFGLVLAGLCMIVLAVQWVRIMWSRD